MFGLFENTIILFFQKPRRGQMSSNRKKIFNEGGVSFLVNSLLSLDNNISCSEQYWQHTKELYYIFKNNYIISPSRFFGSISILSRLFTFITGHLNFCPKIINKLIVDSIDFVQSYNQGSAHLQFFLNRISRLKKFGSDRSASLRSMLKYLCYKLLLVCM